MISRVLKWKHWEEFDYYCNWTRTHNHLVHKRTPNYFAKPFNHFAPASSKEFLDIQATIECGFTLKRVRDMIRTFSRLILHTNFSKSEKARQRIIRLSIGTLSNCQKQLKDKNNHIYAVKKNKILTYNMTVILPSVLSTQLNVFKYEKPN